MDGENRGECVQCSLLERARLGLGRRLLSVVLIQKTAAAGDKLLLSTEKELGLSWLPTSHWLL